MSIFPAKIVTDVTYGPNDEEFWVATRGNDLVGNGTSEDDAIDALLDAEKHERDPFGLLGTW